MVIVHVRRNGTKYRDKIQRDKIAGSVPADRDKIFLDFVPSGEPTENPAETRSFPRLFRPTLRRDKIAGT